MNRKKILLCISTPILILPQLFPMFWKTWIILPVQIALSYLSSKAPLPLFEILLIFAVMWICAGVIHGPLRPVKRLCAAALTLVLLFSALWLPLYRIPGESACASPEQMKLCAEMLIDALNQTDPDFSVLPEDMPVRAARFPVWMRMLNISGFYSFFTGEALISPDQPDCAIPFVAVHESFHGQGLADEGACNIAAYQDCVRRGGLYAASANLWALRYIMGFMNTGEQSLLMSRMNETTRKLYAEIGGAYHPIRHPVLTWISGASNYENLAHHLAANIHE